MPRYVTMRPRSVILYESDMDASVTADQVICPDDGPVDSGLVNPYGQRLFRVSARSPVGFVSEKLTR